MMFDFGIVAVVPLERAFQWRVLFQNGILLRVYARETLGPWAFRNGSVLEGYT